MEPMNAIDGPGPLLDQMGVDVPDRQHALRCAAMAGQIFDGVHQRLDLDATDRQLAVIAALYHDAGYVRGARDHHRKSFDILNAMDFPGLSSRDRVIAACAARYHGRTMPSIEHAGFGEMETIDQHRTRRLSAIVRLAAASDASHLGLVTGARIDASGPQIQMVVEATAEPSVDRDRLHEASGGFTALTYEPIRIEIDVIRATSTEKKGS